MGVCFGKAQQFDNYLRDMGTLYGFSKPAWVLRSNEVKVTETEYRCFYF
jgi:hypothetical protein